ncbi:MAG TPA: TMEM175 family protein [Thermoanaerobaculia bacterium]|jgi:uncharacterized membrane protein
MGKGRLEAFSDGVLAIIITIMVLELKVPHEPELAALGPLVPVLLSYVLSFAFVGIYWNNHHHLMHAVQKVNGNVLWANLYLLFWLSVIPFVTSWMGENHFAATPVALYGVVMLMNAIAFTILTRVLIAHHGKDSTLAIAIGTDHKGKTSLALYAAAIPLAFVEPRLALAIYVLVAIIWFAPDRRIERTLTE